MVPYQHLPLQLSKLLCKTTPFSLWALTVSLSRYLHRTAWHHTLRCLVGIKEEDSSIQSLSKKISSFKENWALNSATTHSWISWAKLEMHWVAATENFHWGRRMVTVSDCKAEVRHQATREIWTRTHSLTQRYWAFSKTTWTLSISFRARFVSKQ